MDSHDRRSSPAEICSRGGRLRAAVIVGVIGLAMVGCGGSPGGISSFSRVSQGVAFDTQTSIKEIDDISRVGLIDNLVIPYSTLTATASSPVKILAVKAMSPSAGVRVLGFIAYRYSQSSGSQGSRGRITAPHRTLVGLSVTHAATFWWQVRVQPRQVGLQSVHGIQVTYEEAGRFYRQRLTVTYLLHVHPAGWKPAR